MVHSPKLNIIFLKGFTCYNNVVLFIEEWVSKKKTEVTNTKQIETRVKRQVVLEDGKVVEDTGPMVTTNTTEDTDTQEHHQTEVNYRNILI